MAALQRMRPHLGMSCFLCRWHSVSGLSLINEECLFCHFPVMLESYFHVIQLFQLKKFHLWNMERNTFQILQFLSYWVYFYHLSPKSQKAFSAEVTKQQKRFFIHSWTQTFSQILLLAKNTHKQVKTNVKVCTLGLILPTLLISTRSSVSSRQKLMLFLITRTKRS